MSTIKPPFTLLDIISYTPTQKPKSSSEIGMQLIYKSMERYQPAIYKATKASAEGNYNMVINSPACMSAQKFSKAIKRGVKRLNESVDTGFHFDLLIDYKETGFEWCRVCISWDWSGKK